MKGRGKMAVADKLNELRVKANLIADKITGMMDIKVEVHDHVAILHGEVENEDQKRAAEELAYEVESIHEVTNDIRVVTTHDDETAGAHLGCALAEGDAGETPISIGGESAGFGSQAPSSEQFLGEFDDAEIEREVRHRLASQQLVDASDVKARSINQIVHLQGSVATTEDLYSLHDLVLNVRGVMGLNSDVEVKQAN